MCGGLNCAEDVRRQCFEMKIKKTVEGDLTWGATPTPDLDNLAA